MSPRALCHPRRPRLSATVLWLGPALSPDAQLRHLLHQCPHLVELPEEPLDVLRQNAGTGGDAAAPRVGEGLRGVPPLSGHRVDPALDPPPALPGGLARRE